jgi:uncharacterized protein
MFTQVYYHRVRRVYDVHLADFLGDWLDEGTFAPALDDHLRLTDSDVFVAIDKAARTTGHGTATKRRRKLALRLCQRDACFKLLYKRNPEDIQSNADASKLIFQAARDQFGSDVVRYDAGGKDAGRVEFPVRDRFGAIRSSTGLSEVLRNVPASRYEYVFVAPGKLEDARSWLETEKQTILDAALETPC